MSTQLPESCPAHIIHIIYVISCTRVSLFLGGEIFGEEIVEVLEFGTVFEELELDTIVGKGTIDLGCQGL